MATLFETVQFLDNEGVPLALGRVYSYVSGSSTPKDTYTSYTAGTAVPTYVQLDAYGRISTGIWLSGSYKLVVKNAAGTTLQTVDNVVSYDLFDWTGLTATVAQLNSLAGGLATPGTVTASKAVYVDSNKDIATFNNLTATTLIATTAVKTPIIKDSNGVVALTIASVASQVNAFKLTPAITGASPTVSAYSTTDTNVDLTLSAQGTGSVKLSGLAYPAVDGSASQVIGTDGAGALSFVTINEPVVLQERVTSSVVSSTTTTVMGYDDTIPQLTEGAEILTTSYTPLSVTSTLYITARIFVGCTVASAVGGIFKNATADSIGGGAVNATVNTVNPIELYATFVPGSLSAITLAVRCGPGTAGTLTFNGASGARLFGGVLRSSMVIVEVGP